MQISKAHSKASLIMSRDIQMSTLFFSATIAVQTRSVFELNCPWSMSQFYSKCFDSSRAHEIEPFAPKVIFRSKGALDSRFHGNDSARRALSSLRMQESMNIAMRTPKSLFQRALVDQIIFQEFRHAIVSGVVHGSEKHVSA